MTNTIDEGRINAMKSIIFQSSIETILQIHFFLFSPALRYSYKVLQKKTTLSYFRSISVNIGSFYCDTLLLNECYLTLFFRLYSWKKIFNFFDSVLIYLRMFNPMEYFRIRQKLRRNVSQEPNVLLHPNLKQKRSKFL